MMAMAQFDRAIYQYQCKTEVLRELQANADTATKDLKEDLLMPKFNLSTQEAFILGCSQNVQKLHHPDIFMYWRGLVMKG